MSDWGLTVGTARYRVAADGHEVLAHDYQPQCASTRLSDWGLTVATARYRVAAEGHEVLAHNYQPQCASTRLSDWDLIIETARYGVAADGHGKHLMNGEPIAFFITWTVYGTWLQGDERGWRRYRGGFEKPQPLLAQWRGERLLHPIILLTQSHSDAVQVEIEHHCRRRGWKLWVANARTNHVHVVVTATSHDGAKSRDQLKANCTRGLREIDERFINRPVWSRGGDWKCINTDDDLAAVIQYASEVQDAKEVAG